MRTIEIDNLILVEVPKDARHFALIESHSYFKSPRIEHSIGGFDLDRKYDYEIIGLIEAPNLEFDFEVKDSWVEKYKPNYNDTDSWMEYYDYINDNFYSINVDVNDMYEGLTKSFRTRIQRKIQDAGIELTGNLLLIKKLK